MERILRAIGLEVVRTEEFEQNWGKAQVTKTMQIAMQIIKWYQNKHKNIKKVLTTRRKEDKGAAC